MKFLTALLVSLFIAVISLMADPVLSKPETVDGKIIIYPDHRTPQLFYYVPVSLILSQTFGQPQFFFYKYIHVKSDAPEGPQTTAGGVLTLSVEFGDETETLRSRKGQNFEYRAVPIETLVVTLSYTGVEEQVGKEKKELASNKIIWTKKSFTLPLSRESASFLWKIFEEKKSTGLSVEATFSYGGYELDETGKLQPGERSARLSLPIPVTMEKDPDLFKVINLAEKFSFNFRRMSVLCFDFINGTNGDVVKLIVEVEIITARRQRDFKTITFSSETEPQQTVEFNIPEVKGAKYRWRVTKYYADGQSERNNWQESNNAFLDLTTYELTIKGNK